MIKRISYQSSGAVTLSANRRPVGALDAVTKTAQRLAPIIPAPKDRILRKIARRKRHRDPKLGQVIDIIV